MEPITVEILEIVNKVLGFQKALLTLIKAIQAFYRSGSPGMNYYKFNYTTDYSIKGSLLHMSVCSTLLNPDLLLFLKVCE